MRSATSADSVLALQEHLVAFIRAFGLHQPDRTPCGRPVPVSEAHALTAVAQVEALGQLELGRQLCLEKSSVSRIVAQLVTRGWVERVADQGDGRASLLRLTSAGRQAFVDLARARAAKFDRLLAEIPEHELDAVLHSLDVLTKALRGTHQ